MIGIKSDRWAWSADATQLPRLASAAAVLLPLWEHEGGLQIDLAQRRFYPWLANETNLLRWAPLDSGAGVERNAFGSGLAYIEGSTGRASGQTEYTVLAVCAGYSDGGNRYIFDSGEPVRVVHINYARGNNELECWWYDTNNSARRVIVDSNHPLRRSHCVIARLRGGICAGFFNGRFIDDTNMLAPARPLNPTYRIFGQHAGGGPHHGSIGLIAVWPFPLSDDDCGRVGRNPFGLLRPADPAPVWAFAVDEGPAPTFRAAWARQSTTTIAPGGPM